MGEGGLTDGYVAVRCVREGGLEDWTMLTLGQREVVPGVSR